MGDYFFSKFYIFFQGVMLFQVVFFGMAYLITKRKEILLYALLNLITAAYFFLNAPDIFFNIAPDTVFSNPAYPYVNFTIFLSIIFLYLLFLKEIFSDTVEEFSIVKIIYKLTVCGFIFFYLLFLLFALLGYNTQPVFYTSHLLNGPFVTIILILNFNKKGYKRLINFGMYVIFFCILITLVFTMRFNAGNHETILDKYPLVILKLGMLIDILFFQFALLYRWNTQEKELAIQHMTTQLEVEKMRNQISTELHDDIGATLSGINLYSHLALKQMETNLLSDVKNSVKIIQISAHEMVDRLKDIVWSNSANNESLEFFFQKFYSYALIMANTKNIAVKHIVEDDINKLNISAVKKYHLYLTCKEVVNNAIKHSKCTLLEINATSFGGRLRIAIRDNGVGFNILNIKQGNGLNNIKARAKKMFAEIEIISNEGAGTITNLTI